MSEFSFNPGKAITAVLVEGDRFMIVGVPGSLRFAPAVILTSNPSRYTHSGFTVVGVRS